MPKRPSSLQYSNTEIPPALSVLTLAAQHSAIVLIYLFYVVIIAKALTLPAATQIAVLSTTLLMCGIGSMLQAKFGSGLLVLFIPSPIYIPVIIAAGLSYGASGIATLLLVAGLVQAIFGSAVRKLRVLFPPEVCGVVVIMLGVSLLPGTLRALVTATAEQTGFIIDYVGLAIGVLHLVAREVQVERALLAAEAGRDPAGQQVDVSDHAIASMAVENDGARCDGFHGSKCRIERR